MKRVSSDRRERTRSSRSSTIASWALTFVVFSVVVYGVFWARGAYQNASTLRVGWMADTVEANLDHHLFGMETALRMTGGYFAGSETVSRKEFYTYIVASELRETNSGFSTFSYVRRVAPDGKSAFEGSVREDRSVVAEGYSGFAIRPEGEREEYWPIVYADPESVAGSLMGADQYADPERRANIERARDTAGITLSTPVTLAPAGRIGAILAVPIYATGSAPGSLDERRAAFSGAVTMAFYAEDLVDHIFAHSPIDERNADIAVADAGIAGDAPETVLNSHASGMRAGTVARLLYRPVMTGREIDFGGRVWRIRVIGRPGYGLSPAEQAAPFIVLLIGTLTSVLLATALSYGRRLQALADLRRENAALQQRYDFITTLSHQLRTPITRIRWGLEAFEEGTADESAVQTALDNTAELSEIADRFLYFFETAETYRPENLSSGDTREHLDDAARVHRAAAKKKGVTISVSGKPKKRAYVDHDAIHAALSILFDNAIVYSKPGGKVRVTVGDATDGVMITVADEGIGIPLKDREKIFSEFFRASNASLGKNAGSGVSLAIAKKIVEAHGGTLAFTSQEGKGSVFTMTLPADKKGR